MLDEFLFVILFGQEVPGQVPVHIAPEDQGLDHGGSLVMPGFVTGIHSSTGTGSYRHLPWSVRCQLLRSFDQKAAEGTTWWLGQGLSEKFAFKHLWLYLFYIAGQGAQNSLNPGHIQRKQYRDLIDWI